MDGSTQSLFPAWISSLLWSPHLNQAGLDHRDDLWWVYSTLCVAARAPFLDIPNTLPLYGRCCLILTPLSSENPNIKKPPGRSTPTQSIVNTLYFCLRDFFSSLRAGWLCMVPGSILNTSIHHIYVPFIFYFWGTCCWCLIFPQVYLLLMSEWLVLASSNPFWKYSVMHAWLMNSMIVIIISKI